MSGRLWAGWVGGHCPYRPVCLVDYGLDGLGSLPL